MIRIAEVVNKSADTVQKLGQAAIKSQSSSAGIQQIARAAEDLNKLTNNMELQIRKFKIGNSGVLSNYNIRQKRELIKK